MMYTLASFSNSPKAQRSGMAYDAIRSSGFRACGVRFVLVLGIFCLAMVGLTGCFVSPQPISEGEHWERSRQDLADAFQGQQLPAGPLTLEEAVARAVNHNLDHRLSQMEAAFHLRELDVANLNMLPRLALNAGYSVRSNESASGSISYQTRKQTLEPSVSSDTDRGTSDLTLSWSLLDFGLSYFQARQQADRYLILRERRRRILNNLVKDVVATYLRVATDEKVGPLIQDTIARAEEALATYKRMEEERKGPLTESLERQRMLLSTIGNLKSIARELGSSRARLAALMNLPLGTDFRVTGPDDSILTPPVLAAGLPDLESIGIYLRPDLREEMYQERIDKYEVKKEMLRMIPGMSMFTSGNWDSNSFLVHDFWAEAGARTTLDILGLAAKAKQVKASKTQVEVTRTRRLAGTVAALVQIHLSYHQYLQAIDAFQNAVRLDEVEEKLLQITTASARAREAGAMDLIRQGMQTVNSRLERDRALIDVYGAWGNLYFSIGGDMLGTMGDCGDFPSLVAATKASIDRWLAGSLPRLPEGVGDLPNLKYGCIAVVSSAGAMASLPEPAPEAGPVDFKPAKPVKPAKAAKPGASGKRPAEVMAK